MPELEVVGWGVEYRIFPITQKVAHELTKKGVTTDRLDEICDSLSDKEIGETGVGTDFSILVDGKSLSRKAINSIPTKVGRDTVLKSGKCYLVRQYEAKGCWFTMTSQEEFDPSNLRITASCLVFPDGSKQQIFDVSYDGENEFGETIPKGDLLSVIMKDGTTMDVVDAD